jgi:hypothetical protein
MRPYQFSHQVLNAPSMSTVDDDDDYNDDDDVMG